MNQCVWIVLILFWMSQWRWKISSVILWSSFKAALTSPFSLSGQPSVSALRKVCFDRVCNALMHFLFRLIFCILGWQSIGNFICRFHSLVGVGSCHSDWTCDAFSRCTLTLGSILVSLACGLNVLHYAALGNLWWSKQGLRVQARQGQKKWLNWKKLLKVKSEGTKAGNEATEQGNQTKPSKNTNKKTQHNQNTTTTTSLAASETSETAFIQNRWNMSYEVNSWQV